MIFDESRSKVYNESSFPKLKTRPRIEKCSFAPLLVLDAV